MGMKLSLANELMSNGKSLGGIELPPQSCYGIALPPGTYVLRRSANWEEWFIFRNSGAVTNSLRLDTLELRPKVALYRKVNMERTGQAPVSISATSEELLWRTPEQLDQLKAAMRDGKCEPQTLRTQFELASGATGSAFSSEKSAPEGNVSFEQILKMLEIKLDSRAIVSAIGNRCVLAAPYQKADSILTARGATPELRVAVAGKRCAP
jgi:hypothetical protein